MKKKLYNLELSNEAEDDFDESYEYYSFKSTKIADNFFNIINASFSDISNNPFQYQNIFKDVRKYVVRKFPFIIYYQINNISIRIIAIFHTSRNPLIWKERTI
jgi:plasmid stabilization system protein ParE